MTFNLIAESKIQLYDYLCKRIPLLLKKDVSKSKVRRLIIAGGVFVNGKQIRIPFYSVYKGSEIFIKIEQEKLFFEKQPDDINFELTQKDILFEDDYIIVVNKPSRFPTEEGMVGSRDNLHSAVVRYLFNKQKIEKPNAKNPPYCGIMHRLDRDTSGVILFTKQRCVNAGCHDMFENHTAKKIYLAVTDGEVKEKNFSVEMFMNRISPKGQRAKWGRVKENDGGLYSKTDFNILDKKNNYALIQCSLHTGRTHQIRVHLSSLNYPILGDELYGGTSYSRIMLHAQSLEFNHPINGEKMKIYASVSDEFRKLGFNCID